RGVAAVKDGLVAGLLAGTRGTSGVVPAQASLLALPDGPTPAELTAFLDGAKDKVKGRIVLAGKHAFVPVNFAPPAKRRTDAQVREQYDPNNPNAGQFGRGRGGRGDQPPPPMTANKINRRPAEFLVAN